jgi:hypothetical protein
MVESYGSQGLDEAVSKSAKYFLRVVPVEKSIDARQTVASFDDACNILKSQKLIVVTDCICRKQKQLLDAGCGKHPAGGKIHNRAAGRLFQKGLSQKHGAFFRTLLS